ncbi:regulatory LuxR family protein [Isoptericola jiangsuensis]|uniref:Regulatory LuxR family protein n=1 Tax=Isoptericola jiangsuensis TaxID=548579 RepID=A0A2A9ETG2_9MICO|nr:helix-turn-helix transcriptional regulator [Isoptericola jiangsuensis]PFG41552.1 regulatory LuxR family protein [Isoptericola jiangsuensis]
MTHVDPTSDDLAALRDILDLADAGRHHASVPVVFEVLRRLEVLLRADGVAFHALDARDFSYRHVQEVDVGAEYLAGGSELGPVDPAAGDGSEVLLDHWWASPCSLVERTGAPAVTSLREHYGQRRWAEHPVHREYLTVDDEIILGYPDGPGRTLRLLAPRYDGPPFGDRERTICRLLLPHLRDLLAAVVTDPSAPAPPQGLTGRQAEILRLVALGMSNRDVAVALGISPTTVRTHLEHAFERLGVTTRTAAVTVAFAGQGQTAPVPAGR